MLNPLLFRPCILHPLTCRTNGNIQDVSFPPKKHNLVRKTEKLTDELREHGVIKTGQRTSPEKSRKPYV